MESACRIKDEPRRADVMGSQAEDIDVEPLGHLQLAHDKTDMVNRFYCDAHSLVFPPPIKPSDRILPLSSLVTQMPHNKSKRRLLQVQTSLVDWSA